MPSAFGRAARCPAAARMVFRSGRPEPTGESGAWLTTVRRRLAIVRWRGQDEIPIGADASPSGYLTACTAARRTDAHGQGRQPYRRADDVRPAPDGGGLSRQSPGAAGPLLDRRGSLFKTWASAFLVMPFTNISGVAQCRSLIHEPLVEHLHGGGRRRREPHLRQKGRRQCRHVAVGLASGSGSRQE